MPELHDVTCAIHVHSTHSDGTGTVPEIAAAARRSGVDAVLLTDHDSLAARRHGEERWHGSTLVLVGEEVSPSRHNHFLAFGVDDEIRHKGLDAAGILASVASAGGFGFAAHPFSRGSEHFSRLGGGMPWRDLASPGLAGVELWSFVTDTAESLGGWADAVRFVARPERFVRHPPERNLTEWDRLCAERRVAAIGGIDAHQLGLRVAGRVPLRLMSYTRSFSHLRTHALCEKPLSGELAPDREQVYAALREGRCYLAMDSLAPARGFAFWAEGDGGPLSMGEEAAAGHWTLHAHTPAPAALRLLRDGQEVARARGSRISHRAEQPGVYRVEARRMGHGAMRTWIVSNPVYLR